MGFFGKRAQSNSKDSETQTQPDASPRKRPSLSNIILILVMLAGAAIIAYPTFSDWWNSYHQSRSIAAYASAVQGADPEVVALMLEEARDHNTRLAEEGLMRALTDDELAEYNSLLDLDGSGIMGYIQMTSLGINYPIYHGVSEMVLQTAIGHLESSSLPVGGKSTHVVITGHRGLPSAKLFSDLDKVKEGDTFTITVLNDTLTYEVDQIRIVEPSDLSSLGVVPGEDYVTLVTCTPYGINTHRLLVRGHRVGNLPGMRVIPAEAVQIPSYVSVPAVGVPLLFVYLAVALATGNEETRAHRQARALKALEQLRNRRRNE